jgi:methyl-accepting chemotaxis protein
MKSTKLSVKIVGGFIMVSLIALFIGYIGTSRISRIRNADFEMYDLNTKPLEHMGEIAAYFQKMRGFLKDVLIGKFVMDKDIDSSISNMKEADHIIEDAMAKFEESVKTADIRKEYESLKSAFSQYFPVRDRIVSLVVEGKREEAIALLTGDGAKVAKQADAAIRKLFELKVNKAKETSKNNVSIARSAAWATWVTAGCGTVLAILLGLYLALSTTRPINRVVHGITEASDHVAAASSQVSGASQQLAEGSSEQAASIEETSSSLEQMASMTKQNAEHANQASHLMAETSGIVSRANGSMSELTASMSEISRASEETSKIIKTIDEIAFQTNLLALNAAVEAARAGEAGAGFAVVADEVRNLAMRAADAAKNTADLIESTVMKINGGSELVEKTSIEFSKVAGSSTKMTELVAEIAAACNEQSQGIAQINIAVNEMDKVVQQNAANAEETASASEEMNAQAEQMKAYVDDLIAVIGGTAKVSGGAMKIPGFLSRNEMAEGRRLPDVGWSGTKPAQKILGKQADSKTFLASGASAAQIIPFEDDVQGAF